MRKTFLLVVLALLVLAGCGQSQSQSQSKSQAPALTEDQRREKAIAAKRDARKAELAGNRAMIVAEISNLIDSEKPGEALRRAAPYRQFQDPDIEALAKKADALVIKGRERELLAKIKATSPNDHWTLMGFYAELRQLVPSNKSYDSQWKKVKASQVAADKKAEARYAAERRWQGVAIGMTKKEVLMSNWGRPESINSTTTAHGTREQWVYGIGNYLYFDESGLLTAIQN